MTCQRAASRSISRTYCLLLDGKPCSSTRAGRAGSPASRTNTFAPLTRIVRWRIAGMTDSSREGQRLGWPGGLEGFGGRAGGSVRGGPVLSRTGCEAGGLEADLGDVGDAGEPEPVGEEAGVEVGAVLDRDAGGVDAAGVDRGGLLTGHQSDVAGGRVEPEQHAGLGDDVDPLLEHVRYPG